MERRMGRFMGESCMLKITLNGSAPVKMFFSSGDETHYAMMRPCLAKK
jgi:hypothetical protein